MASSIAVEATALLATRQVALLAAVRQVEVLESLDALELRLASLGSPEEEGSASPTTSSAAPRPPSSSPRVGWLPLDPINDCRPGEWYGEVR